MMSKGEIVPLCGHYTVHVYVHMYSKYVRITRVDAFEWGLRPR